MTILEPPRIRLDFNGFLDADLYLVSREDVVVDSSGNEIKLHPGLRVWLYADDVDENGAPFFHLATGVIELNDFDDWSSSVRWRCRIDRWES